MRILVSYDISNDKLRTQFMKELKKYGYRLQYSVFEIQNSERILKNLILKIKGKFGKQFSQKDSIYIFRMSATCETLKYGYAKNEDTSLIII
jgi:CRISPR-associated protein Cas2